MKKSKPVKSSIDVDGVTIPLKIYRERRRSSRFYLGRPGGILRLPALMTPQQQKQETTLFYKWVRQKVRAKQAMQQHFSEKQYNSADTLKIGGREYTLHIEYTNNKTHSAQLTGGVIYLRLSAGAGESGQSKAIRHLLSRIIAQDFLPAITERVQQLNERYFQKKVNKIYLKYSLSSWGSCSSKGNINLSTCLLFAPDGVIDYVIIHELAHLVEMNHSPRFWQLVETAVPSYKEKIAWLKNNWGSCNF
ncbi:MAG: M48 family metallopeptidase [Saprospiraceae bacterium]